MRDIVTDKTYRYAMSPVPKDLKKLFKKKKADISKKSVFVPLIDEENPEEMKNFVIVDEEKGKMYLYIDDQLYSMKEVEPDEKCNKDKVLITIYEDPNTGDISFEIISFMMPPRVYHVDVPVENYEIIRAYYYELPPYAYFYYVPFSKVLKGNEKKMYLDKVSKILEFTIKEDMVCDVLKLLNLQELELLKKALGIEEEENAQKTMSDEKNTPEEPDNTGD